MPPQIIAPPLRLLPPPSAAYCPPRLSHPLPAAGDAEVQSRLGDQEDTIQRQGRELTELNTKLNKLIKAAKEQSEYTY